MKFFVAAAMALLPALSYAKNIQVLCSSYNGNNYAVLAFNERTIQAIEIQEMSGPESGNRPEAVLTADVKVAGLTDHRSILVKAADNRRNSYAEFVVDIDYWNKKDSYFSRQVTKLIQGANSDQFIMNHPMTCSTKYDSNRYGGSRDFDKLVSGM